MRIRHYPVTVSEEARLVCHWRGLREGSRSLLRRESGDRSCWNFRGENHVPIFASAFPEMDQQSHLCLHHHCPCRTEHQPAWHCMPIQSGAVIPNAKVELLEHGVPVASVATDSKGQFIIPRNPGPGSRLRVSASGFGTVERSIDSTSDGRELTVDIVLPVASLSEQITVTSTGSPTPQAQLGAAVTVLNPDDYQGTRDIQEGLRFVPGLEVTQTGQAGGTTSVFIRGAGRRMVGDATRS